MNRWKRWYEENKERKLRRQKERKKERGAEELSTRHREWYVKNKNKRLSSCSSYYFRNKGKYRLRDAARKRLLAKATPSWADNAKMEQLYRAAALMTTVTGSVYHVDHVVPIRGKNVCGLHVETNMRVVPAAVNLSKGNSFHV